MPLPPVVVEIVAHDVRPELSAALLAACSRAVEGADCVEAGEVDSSEQPSAVAIVSWLGDARVQIQVGLSREREWRTRQLDFREEDAEVERWTTAGFATGTLAGEFKEQTAPQSAPPAKESPREVRTVAPPASPKRPSPLADPAAAPSSATGPAVWTDLTALVGRGLSNESPRVGGLLRASVAAGGAGPYGSIAFGYAAAREDSAGVGARWLRVGLAGGYAWRPLECELCAQVYAELAGEQIRVWASDEPSGRVDARTRRSAGIRAGGSAAWMFWPMLGVFVGAEVGWLEPGRDVWVRGEHHTEVPRFQAAGLAGVRWRPR